MNKLTTRFCPVLTCFLFLQPTLSQAGPDDDKSKLNEVVISNLDKSDILPRLLKTSARLLEVINHFDQVRKKLSATRILKSPRFSKSLRIKLTAIEQDLVDLDDSGFQIILNKSLVKHLNSGLSGRYGSIRDPLEIQDFTKTATKLTEGQTLADTNAALQKIQTSMQKMIESQKEFQVEYKNLLSTTSWWSPRKDDVAAFEKSENSLSSLAALLIQYHQIGSDFKSELHVVTQLFEEVKKY